MKKLYSFEVKEKAAKFLSCQTLDDLKQLGFDSNQIILKSIHPPYYTFEMRKKNGGVRKIEAPEADLKELQKQFNFYLQCVYYSIQTQAAQGFIIRVRDTKQYKNILENARQHLGAKYMINVDFEDFFHQITSERILGILQNPPFQFDKKTAHTLAKLFTRHGRLPMGAPTSPVFSNLASIALDEALQDWAKDNALVYTRFVDDLTFSSKENPIDAIQLVFIKEICFEHELKINPAKTKYFDKQKTKKVTGLVLNETIDIDPIFYQELDKDLKRLAHTAEVNLIMEAHNKNDLLKTFKQEVEGQINFIGMIEGYGSQIFYQYRQRLKNALNPKEEALSARWTNSNYF